MSGERNSSVERIVKASNISMYGLQSPENQHRYSPNIPLTKQDIQHSAHFWNNKELSTNNYPLTNSSVEKISSFPNQKISKNHNHTDFSRTSTVTNNFKSMIGSNQKRVVVNNNGCGAGCGNGCLFVFLVVIVIIIIVSLA